MDTSFELRQLIITHHQGGVSCRRIAELLAKPKSTVIDIVQRFKRTGSIQPSRTGRCGRPRKLTDRDERALLRKSVSDPKLTAREIRSNVGSAVLGVSISTVKRCLRRRGRLSFRPVKSPSLNAAQRKVRLQWCKQFRDWDEEKWQQVSITSMNEFV
jgi:transposase